MKRILKKIFGTSNNKQSMAPSTNDETLINTTIKVDSFLHELIIEAVETQKAFTLKLSTLEHYKLLKTKPESFKKALIHVLIRYKNSNHSSTWKRNSYLVKQILSTLLSLLVRSKNIHFNDDELLQLSIKLTANKKGFFHTSEWPINPLLTRIEKKIEKDELTPTLKKSLNNIQKFISKLSYVYSEETKILNRIKRIKEGPKEFSVSISDDLGKAILTTSKTLDNQTQATFISLLNHFSKGKEKSKPTKTWLTETEGIITSINNVPFLIDSFNSWIDLTISQLKQIHKINPNHFTFFTDENLQLLRSAIWSSPIINDDRLNQSIEALGLWSFKKLTGYGAISVKLGNACIYAFSKLPYKDGVSRLTIFRMKIKYPSVQTLISKAIIRVAEAEGKTMDEIEELAVQDYNLNPNFELIKAFNTYKGIIKIKDTSTVSLLWENDKGKQIKTIPKYVKDNYPEDLKVFKKQAKDITSNLSAQRRRIEHIFISKREWSFEQWKALYLDNRFLAFFGEKLIWNFIVGTETTSAIFYNGNFICSNGDIFTNVKNSKVNLWHPVTAKTEAVEQWRNWLFEHKVKQPFKQAHREVYIVTDAEKTTNSYSNRFAAHIIRQHIFNALCKERGWKYQLQGQWDSFNTPTLNIRAWNYKVEFWTDTDGVFDLANDMGVLNYLQTDQVRFYHENSQVNMVDVPDIVFSETMRDVDLFIGVTSIGADPNWQDGGEERFRRYWNDFSFGILTNIGSQRKTVLENLIPKLQIKNQCSFEGNFLVVKGRLRVYKIHMGSGNILMKPNDQYLCIVANRKKDQNVFLPFEGDTTLSIILSKAFMLANDHTIKDITITSQINNTTG